MSDRKTKGGKQTRKRKRPSEASTSTERDEGEPGGSGDVTPPSGSSSDGGAAKVPRTTKREGYLSWEEYFMAIACLSAQRSKDPVTQVGACIVNQDNKIVGTGYNGMPIGCSDDDMPWGKDPSHPEESKHSYVCHAEMNAIVNKLEADIRGCTVYVTRFPCNECAKLIIQSGIKRVVYFADDRAEKPETRVSKRLFARAQVKHSPYMRKEYKTKIELDLNALSTPQPGTQ